MSPNIGGPFYSRREVRSIDKLRVCFVLRVSFFCLVLSLEKQPSRVLALGRELEEQPAQEKRNQSFLASHVVMFRSDSDDSQEFSLKIGLRPFFHSNFFMSSSSELNITPCFAKNSRFLSFATVFYPKTE